MQHIDKFDGPFTLKEFTGDKIDLKKAKEILDGLVATKKLRNRKIGRMNIWWKPEETTHGFLTPTESSLDPHQVSQSQMHCRELELEIKKLRKQLNALEQSGPSDFSPWKATCLEMARVLAETRGVTIQEVFTYFEIDMTED